jgi:hypothetical protein
MKEQISRKVFYEGVTWCCRTSIQTEIQEMAVMNMKSIGGLLFLLGIGSILLGFTGLEFKLLMWVDNWGETIGWLIRAAFIVIGAAMWFIMAGRANNRVQT